MSLIYCLILISIMYLNKLTAKFWRFVAGTMKPREFTGAVLFAQLTGRIR